MPLAAGQTDGPGRPFGKEGLGRRRTVQMALISTAGLVAALVTHVVVMCVRVSRDTPGSDEIWFGNLYVIYGGIAVVTALAGIYTWVMGRLDARACTVLVDGIPDGALLGSTLRLQATLRAHRVLRIGPGEWRLRCIEYATPRSASGSTSDINLRRDHVRHRASFPVLGRRLVAVGEAVDFSADLPVPMGHPATTEGTDCGLRWVLELDVKAPLGRAYACGSQELIVLPQVSEADSPGLPGDAAAPERWLKAAHLTCERPEDRRLSAHLEAVDGTAWQDVPVLPCG